MTHRIWGWYQGRYAWIGTGHMEPVTVDVMRGARLTDAVAAGGSWRVDQEDPLNVSFAPGWCGQVIMRDCWRSRFPDGTEEVGSQQVEVVW